MKCFGITGLIFLLLCFNTKGQGKDLPVEKKNRLSLEIGYPYSTAIKDVKAVMVSNGFDDPTTGWLFRSGETIEHPSFSGPGIFVSADYRHILSQRSALGLNFNYISGGEVHGYSNDYGYVFIQLRTTALGFYYSYYLGPRIELDLGPVFAMNTGNDVSASGVRNKKAPKIGVDAKVNLALVNGRKSFWGIFIEFIVMPDSDFGIYNVSNYIDESYYLPVNGINFSTIKFGLSYGFKF